ncbi:MAG: 50S ribosomal protein L9 [Deltaproteobacteria bacterium RIFOXYD12_FULL_57_12]|nr:MAG: 50S ribosomal protein L9 [Deltaproteobacteria bacterium RIFOXYD12_FULL_57_12]
MELILKTTVDTLGEEGDIVKVKPGYARNYLLPQRMAVVATKTNLAILKQENSAIATRKKKQRDETEALVKKLSGTVVTIAQRVGEENKLFGSVTAGDIGEKLAELGIEVDRKKILLAEPIKTIGDTEVAIKVGFQMTAAITVRVVPLEAA